jgi:MFS family permease
MFSSSFWWILIVELLTGFAWAGFNLISFNFMLQLMPDRKNSEKFVGFFNLVSGLGAFAGALLGGLLAANFEKIVLPFGWPYLFALFILSFVLRLFFSLFLLPRVIENEKFSPVSLEVLSITTIRPWRGLVFELMHDFNFVKTIPSRTKLEIMGFAARASDRLERARGHILDIHKNHLTPQKLSEKLNSAQKEMVKVSGLIFKMGKKSEELRKEKKAVEKDKAV